MKILALFSISFLVFFACIQSIYASSSSSSSDSDQEHSLNVSIRNEGMQLLRQIFTGIDLKRREQRLLENCLRRIVKIIQNEHSSRKFDDKFNRPYNLLTRIIDDCDNEPVEKVLIHDRLNEYIDSLKAIYFPKKAIKTEDNSSNQAPGSIPEAEASDEGSTCATAIYRPGPQNEYEFHYLMLNASSDDEKFFGKLMNYPAGSLAHSYARLWDTLIGLESRKLNQKEKRAALEGALNLFAHESAEANRRDLAEGLNINPVFDFVLARINQEISVKSGTSSSSSASSDSD